MKDNWLHPQHLSTAAAVSTFFYVKSSSDWGLAGLIYDNGTV